MEAGGAAGCAAVVGGVPEAAGSFLQPVSRPADRPAPRRTRIAIEGRGCMPVVYHARPVRRVR